MIVIVKDGGKWDGARMQADITSDSLALIRVNGEDTVLLPNEWEEERQPPVRKRLTSQVVRYADLSYARCLTCQQHLLPDENRAGFVCNNGHFNSHEELASARAGL